MPLRKSMASIPIHSTIHVAVETAGTALPCCVRQILYLPPRFEEPRGTTTPGVESCVKD